MPLFPSRMGAVSPDNQWLAEEHILGFFGRYAMAIPVLPRVAIVPVESDAVFQYVSPGHVLSI